MKKKLIKTKRRNRKAGTIPFKDCIEISEKNLSNLISYISIIFNNVEESQYECFIKLVRHIILNQIPRDKIETILNKFLTGTLLPETSQGPEIIISDNEKAKEDKELRKVIKKYIHKSTINSPDLKSNSSDSDNDSVVSEYPVKFNKESRRLKREKFLRPLIYEDLQKDLARSRGKKATEKLRKDNKKINKQGPLVLSPGLGTNNPFYSASLR